MIRLGWIVLCTTAPYLHGVNNLRLPDIRSLAMGENGVTQSVFYNPALLSLKSTKEIYLSYYNRYLIKELGILNSTFCLPSSFISTGIHLSSFGYEAYRENMIRFLTSKQLHHRWILGISFQYSFLQTEIPEERSSYLATDIGIVYTVTDNLLIGVSVINSPSFPISKKHFTIREFTEYRIETGLQYRFINQVLIAGTISSTPTCSVAGSFGLEYMLPERFRVYAGIKTNPLLPSFGCGYTLLDFAVDVAVLFHPVLGVSTGVGLSYSF